MKIDKKPLELLRVGKLITERPHKSEKLFIYNYTNKCMALSPDQWSPELLQCRGLILREDGEVVARPFDKWFNQNADHPHEGKFKAYDKIDGSLGILYPYDSGKKLAIATRGSFQSYQAYKGTRLLMKYVNSRYVKKMLLDLCRKYTFMFEIIFPDNKIVVDYGDSQSLVFLGAREIESGKVLLPEEMPEVSEWFTCARQVENPYQVRDNAEGVVLYYEDGFMEKVKYEEYVRLHRLVTGVTARSIWDLLRTGHGVQELTDRVPEGFAKWVKKEASKIQDRFDVIKKEYTDLFVEIYDEEGDRKQFAMEAQTHTHPGILFAMLDAKDYEGIIWKLIKPEAETPYKEEV